MLTHRIKKYTDEQEHLTVVLRDIRTDVIDAQIKVGRQISKAHNEGWDVNDSCTYIRILEDSVRVFFELTDRIITTTKKEKIDESQDTL